MTEDDDRIMIRDAKNHLYKTTILDKFECGWMIEIHASNQFGIDKKIYKVQNGDDTFIFKSILCPLKDTEALEQVRNEYKLSMRCAKLTEAVAKPLDYMEGIDKILKKNIESL